METKAFHKILIANRGEIALRIMRTCRDLGIATVAVYSDADIRAPHVRYADEAVRIGPAPSKESYLRIEKIIEAAQRTGAEAIHPGYGFLAENADFVAACENAGLTFIGPSAEVIRKMGLKSTARQIMAEAGIPVVPGYDGSDQSFENLRARILEIGLPVLIKASAGGGGKGMRVVRDAGEIEAALEGARREAEKSFGDGTLLLEKYIENARHIEFQILGDLHGNLVHLPERDCSIQRRHQKIIEESPSPAMTDELRQRMGASALKAGRAVGYHNAGTVEFILAPNGEFYFIEVNTRLQVEHPVTEEVVGLDLVEVQIHIAEGKRVSEDIDLRLAAHGIERYIPTGHAIEARLYAEDPDNSFLPATGTVYDWELPIVYDVRIDIGVERGDKVGIYYDPMLAKIIAHGLDREMALRKLVYALRNLSVQGVQTNRDFLIRLLEHPAFREGKAHTGFIQEHLSELLAQDDEAYDLTAAAVAALFIQKALKAENQTLPGIPLNYRNNPYRDPSLKLQVGTDICEVSFRLAGDDIYKVRCGDWQAEARVVDCDAETIRLSLDCVHRQFRVIQAGEKYFVHSPQGSRTVVRLPRHPVRQVASEQETANATMPGQVIKILATPGQQVAAGDPLVILEAMKMEQTIRAAMDGVVESVLVKTGDVVGPGEPLVHINAL